MFKNVGSKLTVLGEALFWVSIVVSGGAFALVSNVTNNPIYGIAAVVAIMIIYIPVSWSVCGLGELVLATKEMSQAMKRNEETLEKVMLRQSSTPTTKDILGMQDILTNEIAKEVKEVRKEVKEATSRINVRALEDVEDDGRYPGANANDDYIDRNARRNDTFNTNGLNRREITGEVRGQREPMDDLRSMSEPMDDLRNRREPMDDLRSVREPMDDLRNRREPMDDLRSMREPMDDLRNRREPMDDLRSMREPVDDLRNRREPMDDLRSM